MRARLLWLFCCALAFGAAACAANGTRDDAAGPTTPPGSAVGAVTGLDASLEAPLTPRLAGSGTAFKTQADAFGFSVRNLDRGNDIVFGRGTDDFVRAWTATAEPDADGEVRAGLGPQYNTPACSSCHVNHGRGLLAEVVDDPPPIAPGVADPELGLLLRLSVPGSGPHGEVVPEPTYGDQLQNDAIDGAAPEGSVAVRYEDVPGTYADGTPYTLRRAYYAVADPQQGPLAADTLISPRLAPPVIGMGLLEAIPAEAVEGRADPDDRDGDGISGRTNQVWDPVHGTMVLGRFGWKAAQPTVESQTAGALFGDMGITSPLHPGEDGSKEIDGQRFTDLVVYTRLVAVPAMRDVDDPQVRAGAEQFTALGCAACHTPTQRTGRDPVLALSNTTVHPFTDLLLHDMGEGLADGRPDNGASGTEWRTPPLWGIGLTEVVGGHEAYLHDGRARSLEEAILWHGGEGESARERFRNASREQREALLAYLRAI